MPRSVKSVKRSRAKATFRNKKNAAKREKQKLKKKIGKPGVGHVLHDVWDEKKSVRENLRSAGLVFNPNEVIPLPKKNDVEAMDLDQVSKLRTAKKQKTKKAKGLAKKLEAEAKAQAEKQAARPPHRLKEPEVLFCTKMIQKHGDDFEAMARDHENVYQNTAKQIERKVKLFMKSDAFKPAEAMES